MKYKASWKYTSGYKYIILILIIIFLIFGLFSKEWIFFVIGLLLLIYFILLPFRIYSIILEDRIIYQGWFSKTEILLDEVTSLICSDAFKYPRDRYYGPLTYEVRSEKNLFLINLHFFNPEFNIKFHDLLKKKRKYKKTSDY